MLSYWKDVDKRERICREENVVFAVIIQHHNPIFDDKWYLTNAENDPSFSFSIFGKDTIIATNHIFLLDWWEFPRKFGFNPSLHFCESNRRKLSDYYFTPSWSHFITQKWKQAGAFSMEKSNTFSCSTFFLLLFLLQMSSGLQVIKRFYSML